MLNALFFLLMITASAVVGLYGAYHFQQEDGPAAGLTFRQWLWPFLRSLPDRWRDRKDDRADYDRPRRATGNADQRGVPATARSGNLSDPDVVLPRGAQPAPAPPSPFAPLPAPPAALPPAAEAPPGAPSAGGAQSDLLYAMGALAAEASNGDVRAVRRVIATLSEVTGEMGGVLVRLGMRLAEPDKDYGPEIWEPSRAAGAQCNAAGLMLAEADAMLVSLIGTTVGELADSPRRAPHSSQLNGGA